ncbi:hypothetical protein I5Q82_14045 [Acutalibacter muris]|uniref:Uncharacterized protein n=1 Tax=Acutalibacter muris TaxID=1796620 RepID=A0A1Z2XN53_9FIRM|nr:hypothetical protein [Acutalibacter muris]ASB39879.1 hypothetical protein ADH66_03980 [Acutalibacter muris]MCI9191960.1 hypothetical protein [Acutalibacter muris]MCI9544309.1 hypothetical protein [Acutalibacter muris]QQR29168.1 hypothetical protein I5Q82_14045 [Acutalibacter muris]
MNVVLMLGGLLLMAIGTAEIWRWAGGRRMSKTEKACRGQAVVLVLPEGPEDCECLVRCAGERLLQGGDCRFVCVVKDPESREIGLRLRERYRGLEICGPGELEKLLGAGL